MNKIAVLPGDGIGQEVMTQAIKVLKKASELYDIDLVYEFADVGDRVIAFHHLPPVLAECLQRLAARCTRTQEAVVDLWSKDRDSVASRLSAGLRTCM